LNSLTPPAAAAAERLPLSVRIANLIAVILPLVGLATAIALLWGTGFSWVHLGLLFGMYAVTVLGVTVGFHRLFTHRAFETNPVVKTLFAVFGSMAVQGPLLKWVALHRQHHQHSDHDDDPHSPHAAGGKGILGMLKGMYHAHLGWMFKPDAPDLLRYAADLQKDKVLRWISATFPLWVVLGLVIPTVLGGVLTMSWTGALSAYFWASIVRIGVLHHMTWSINSICHTWGTRPFKTTDRAVNVWRLAVLSGGESWHNLHHADPTCARHGVDKGQVDSSARLIQLFEKAGWAWDVRWPKQARLDARRAA